LNPYSSIDNLESKYDMAGGFFEYFRFDYNFAFVGDRPQDILDSITRFPNSCGEEGWKAMERLVPVLELARERALPVIYTTGDLEHPLLDRLSWGAKNKRVDQWRADPQARLDANAVPDLIAPVPGEVVITKKKPSAFFGTPLLQYLVSLGVDQLLISGTTTSGCIRASVLDAFSHGYRVAVLEDSQQFRLPCLSCGFSCTRRR